MSLCIFDYNFTLDIYDERSYNIHMNKRMLKKRQIMADSIHVMFQQGYHATGIKDLTDAAGIPKGSLYNYFENKEDYAKEALRYFHSVMGAEYFSILKEDLGEPLERIKTFYKRMIKGVADDGNHYSGCFIGKMTQEMGAGNDSIREVIQVINAEIVGDLENNLKEAANNGTITNYVDMAILAEAINNSWQGALQSIKISRNLEPLEHFYEVLITMMLV